MSCYPLRRIAFFLSTAESVGKLALCPTVRSQPADIPVFADVAIAATAKAHGLVLLTRNGRHFASLGVAFIDPIEGLPAEP
jgi:predicted nucleic acid-binding protein